MADTDIPSIDEPDLDPETKSKQAVAAAAMSTANTRDAQGQPRSAGRQAAQPGPLQEGETIGSAVGGATATPLQAPTYGFERFVERGLSTAGPRTSRFNRGKQAGGRFAKKGHPLDGMSQGEGIEWMRDKWKALHPSVRAKYSRQSTMADVTTPTEQKHTEAYRKQEANAIGNGNSPSPGSSPGSTTQATNPNQVGSSTGVQRPRRVDPAHAAAERERLGLGKKKAPGIYTNERQEDGSTKSTPHFKTKVGDEEKYRTRQQTQDAQKALAGEQKAESNANKKKIRARRNQEAIAAGKGKVGYGMNTTTDKGMHSGNREHANRYGSDPSKAKAGSTPQGGSSRVPVQRVGTDKSVISSMQTINKMKRSGAADRIDAYQTQRRRDARAKAKPTPARVPGGNAPNAPASHTSRHSLSAGQSTNKSPVVRPPHPRRQAAQ